MSSSTFPKRSPAIHCWIKHIIEGNYNIKDNAFYTIFGKVKRIRIVATIVDKREEIISSDEGIDELVTNIRLNFYFDDGTGLLRGNIKDVEPEEYNDFNIGDIVMVVGRVSKWEHYISFWIEIMKKVDNPNYILLKNAEIIKRIQSGDIQKIPEFSEEIYEEDEISGEIDVNALFEEKDLKENVYSVIKKSSDEKRGLRIEDLLKAIDVSEQEINKNIEELEKESRVFHSEENNEKYYYTY